MLRGVWQHDHCKRGLPSHSGFSNGILGSPSKRSLRADDGGAEVGSVYVTISPDASGCSALLLLVGKLQNRPIVAV
jgi:hypothetical protein